MSPIVAPSIAERGYISVPRAAEILGVSRCTMIAILNEGEISCTRPRKHRRVDVASLMRYRAKRTESGVPMIEVLADDPLAD